MALSRLLRPHAKMPTFWSNQHRAALGAEEKAPSPSMGADATKPALRQCQEQEQEQEQGLDRGTETKRKGPSLKNRALRLLTNREHSRNELERKLAPYEEAPGQLAKVLDELAAKDFISHERLVASVVYRRSAKVGVRRVAQELQQKGIAPVEMQEAIAALKSTEMDRARAVWLRKFGVAATTPQEKARQLRFMASRGFGAEVLYKVVGDPEDDL